MYDLSFFRQNLDAIATRLADRGFTLDVGAFRQLDAERRAALTESEQLKALRKTESQEIGKTLYFGPRIPAGLFGPIEPERRAGFGREVPAHDVAHVRIELILGGLNH